MINRVKSYVASYSVIYWITLIFITLLSIGLFVLNNFSSMPTKQMMADALEDSVRVSESLSVTKESFAAYDVMLNRLANSIYTGDDRWLDTFESQSVILFDGFSALHPHISGYFINIDSVNARPIFQKYHDFKTGRDAHISVFVDSSFIYGSGGLNSLFSEYKEPLFVTVPSSFVGGFDLSYVVPLYVNDQYRGLFGVVLDKETLGGMFGDNADGSRQMGLMTADLDVIASTNGLPAGTRIDSFGNSRYSEFAKAIRASTQDSGYVRSNDGGRAWIHVYVKLSGGQIFWESFALDSWLLVPNLLIVILFALALFCIWFAQKKKNGISPFDRLVDVALMKIRGVSDEVEIANKASFAIHITVSFITLALFVFSLVGSASVIEKIAFGSFFLMTLVMLLWYRKPDHGQSKKYVYVGVFMLTPVALHHLTGGFASQNAGQVIVLTLTAVMLSSFSLRNKKHIGVFPVFVSVLFLDAIVEIFTGSLAATEMAIRFINIIFFLGFAIYLSTDLYVTGVTDLLNRLKNAQSKLVQKEKMVTLGRLISGIAHEINTPLGAIKASVENIESSLRPAFVSLMDAGRILSSEERDLYFRLVEMATVSMSHMYTTMEVRRSKPALRAFFTELGHQDPQSMTESLARLEICDVEMLRQNSDIFESEHIQTLLFLLTKTAALMRSAYIISQSTAKTSKIVFALKSYSYTTISGDPTWLNIVQNIDNVLVLLYNQMKSGIELIRDYDNDIPEILGNPDELSQVWINLLQNAIYAMSGAGKLTISIKMEPDAVMVAVADSGCGIDDGTIKHIFEPFFTTKEVGEGTGLGLDICKKIITGHKGSITVRSKPGEGSVFEIRLPLVNTEH